MLREAVDNIELLIATLLIGMRNTIIVTANRVTERFISVV
jgi:hypothetical protein